MRKPIYLALFYLLFSFVLQAAPTELKPWKSKAGTTLEAKAVTVENGEVSFERKDGKTLKVPLDKLADADRKALEEHFKVDATGNAAPDLGHPQGETSGPIDAGGSKYFVYLPKSLKGGRKYPLLFYTASGGGSKDTLNALTEGAEICGWVVACSVESKNETDPEKNHEHAKKCVEHLKKTLPLDEKRIYFGGNSGGARMAFTNASKLDGAGVLAQIAGAKPDELKKGNHYFFISGAYDYNRYGTSASYSEVARSAALRFHPGGHDNGPDWLVTEGLVWLEGQYQRKAKEETPARADYEAAVLDWIAKLKTTEDYRAAWWAGFLRESGVMAANESALGAYADLTAEPANAAYADGLSKLEEFAAMTLSTGPQSAPDCFEHTSEEIQREAKALQETFGNTPRVKDIIEGLLKKTDKG
ncbi:hypothetical protein [Luteolibacter luteus]|uniref:Alpha/beta hydrolase n=1 Tax=Luteolibacter luteus TaxID=2728835 RepID=A0A858RG89_9BACT|nr:hypothetical protein [Luteolibacter luteus]QJE95782.1 hypothetical protein HHL09_08280 [Luteolibacter luteus]